jgi:hypothetical protein
MRLDSKGKSAVRAKGTIDQKKKKKKKQKKKKKKKKRRTRTRGAFLSQMDAFFAQAVALGVDEEQALFFLEASGGDEMAALRMIEQQRPQAERATNDSTFTHDQHYGDERAPHYDEDDVRAPIRPTERHVLSEQPAGPSRLVPAMPPHAFNPFSSGRNVVDSRQPDSHERRAKMQKLEQMYRPPVEITFVGEFNDAIRLAERSGKWLLVNVQDAKDFRCQMLNRDTWSSEALRNLVVENFVFWQPDVSHPHGEYYARFYPVNEYPHIAVIDPATRARFPEAIWEGLIEAADLKKALQHFLDMHTAVTSPGARMTPGLNDSMDISEKAMLERALAESLQQNEDDNVDVDLVAANEVIDVDDEEALLKRAIAESLRDEQDEVVEVADATKKRKVETDGKTTASVVTKNGSSAAVVEPEKPAVKSAGPADTNIRVRDPQSGTSQVIRLNGNDTIDYLWSQAALSFSIPKESFELVVPMPKVYVTALPKDSTVSANGLANLTLLVERK